MCMPPWASCKQIWLYNLNSPPKRLILNLNSGPHLQWWGMLIMTRIAILYSPPFVHGISIWGPSLLLRGTPFTRPRVFPWNPTEGLPMEPYQGSSNRTLLRVFPRNPTKEPHEIKALEARPYGLVNCSIHRVTNTWLHLMTNTLNGLLFNSHSLDVSIAALFY